MAGQKPEFFVVVENRRPRAWAVICKAKALGNFFVNTGGTHPVRVLGTNYCNCLCVTAGIAGVDGKDLTKRCARHIDNNRDAARIKTGHQFRDYFAQCEAAIQSTS